MTDDRLVDRLWRLIVADETDQVMLSAADLMCVVDWYECLRDGKALMPMEYRSALELLRKHGLAGEE